MGEIIGGDDLSPAEREQLMLQALGGSPDKASRMLRSTDRHDVRANRAVRQGVPVFPRFFLELQEVAPSPPEMPRWTRVRFIGGQVRLFGQVGSASSTAHDTALATFG